MLSLQILIGKGAFCIGNGRGETENKMG